MSVESVASKLIFDRTVYSITVSGEVEKVSRNVDMYTTPVYFGDFNNCTVNFNFKILQLSCYLKCIPWPLFICDN